MRYRVEWLESAENELADVWMRSAFRGDVTRASDALDRRLEEDAHEVGESREPGMRVENLWPLGIYFSVDEAVGTVKVVNVWEYRGRA